jgi:hypothetical protein
MVLSCSLTLTLRRGGGAGQELHDLGRLIRLLTSAEVGIPCTEQSRPKASAVSELKSGQKVSVLSTNCS